MQAELDERNSQLRTFNQTIEDLRQEQLQLEKLLSNSQKNLKNSEENLMNKDTKYNEISNEKNTLKISMIVIENEKKLVVNELNSVKLLNVEEILNLKESSLRDKERSLDESLKLQEKIYYLEKTLKSAESQNDVIRVQLSVYNNADMNSKKRDEMISNNDIVSLKMSLADIENERKEYFEKNSVLLNSQIHLLNENSILSDENRLLENNLDLLNNQYKSSQNEIQKLNEILKINETEKKILDEKNVSNLDIINNNKNENNLQISLNKNENMKNILEFKKYENKISVLLEEKENIIKIMNFKLVEIESTSGIEISRLKVCLYVYIHVFVHIEKCLLDCYAFKISRSHMSFVYTVIHIVLVIITYLFRMS